MRSRPPVLIEAFTALERQLASPEGDTFGLREGGAAVCWASDEGD